MRTATSTPSRSKLASALPVEMRTSTCGCAATNELRRGISQSPAKPAVVLTTTGWVSLAMAERPAGAVDRRQRLGRRLLEGAALLGQHERAVHAAKQLHPEPVLQGLDLPANRRLGQRDLVAGPGEAQVAARGLEGHQHSSGGTS
jgi:hypothetical protein